MLYGGWAAYQSFETIRTESAAQRVLDSTDDIKGVPPKIEVTRGGRALTLSGFVPSPELRDQILRRLHQEVPQAKITNQLGVLPRDASEVEAALAQWRADAERQQRDVTASAIARSMARVGPRLEAARTAITLTTQQPAIPASADLTRALDEAVRQSRSAGDGRTSDTAQLAALWQLLSRIDAQMSALSLGSTSGGIRVADTIPSDRQQLAEEASIFAERISAASLGVGPASTLAVLASKVERLRPPTARDELEQFSRSAAIFFGNGSDFRDAKSAAEILDQLARRLKANPDVIIRVVGYTDERGGNTINSNLAQTRADRIAAALTDRGISANRIASVGRLTAKDLSRTAGVNSANRRVEFEIGFIGETDPAQ